MCINFYRLFPDLGIYSGIFVIYLHFALKDSRTTTIVFYALCLLYVLSTVTVVCDLLSSIIDSDAVSNNSICKIIISLLVMLMRLNTLPVQFQIDLQSRSLYRITIVQGTVIGCCDVIAQCTLVRINHYIYHLFYLQRSTVVGSCGVKISGW